MLHNKTDDFEKVCPNFQFMINGTEPEYLIFRGKFRVLEYFGSASNNPETKPQWYVVIVILEQEITIEKLSEQWIGYFVWLMQAARAKVLKETEGLLDLRKRVSAGLVAFGIKDDTGSYISIGS